MPNRPAKPRDPGRQGSKPNEPKRTTKGRYIAPDGTIYYSTLNAAVHAEGVKLGLNEKQCRAQYARAWLAFRGRSTWKDDMLVQPATEAQERHAERTATYEVELVHDELSLHAVEEWLLQLGAAVRRLRWEKLPKQRSTRRSWRRAVWVVTGLSEPTIERLRAYLRDYAARVQQVDAGQHVTLLKGQAPCPPKPDTADGDETNRTLTGD